MPGYDDPRYLQQVIEKLQHDVKKLQSITLPFLTHQKGATAGSMRAVSIGDVGQKSSMWINLVGSQPSQAPYIAVSDTTGRVRWEAGFLAAYTDPSGIVSPQGYGMRSIDANGNIIFDTIGASQVFKSLGITDVINQTFTSTTFATVTGSGVTFTLSRQVNIYATFLGTGNVSTNNGNVGFLRARLTSGGGNTSGNENFGVLANFAQTSSGWLFIPALAAGTWTIQLDAAVNATPQTFNLIEAALQVFQLGA